MAPIATVTGTAIRPGISKNNRKYTAEAIGRMVERAQARIDDPDGMPITMLTHHAAEDDSTRLVGQVLRIWQESDGAAKFEAAIDDTEHGRSIAKLADPKGRTKPTLKGVSIRGAWLGKVRRETDPEAGAVETASDLELDGLDFTRKPGVTGAGVDSVDHTPSQPRESDGTVRVPITESAPEATVTIIEADAPSTSKRGSGLKGEGGPYADPGYQKDGKQRYQIGDVKKARAAWSYINQADNARLYTSAQLKRIKARIVKALKGFGVTVATQEGWLIGPAAPVTEELAECWDMDGRPSGDLYVSLTNGPTTVTVSSRLLDAHDLDAVGRAAMAGACDALMALDPDMDADIDVPGAEPEDDDDRGADESVPFVVDGQPLLAEHFAALKETGVLDQLEPGTVVTAAMVNEALTLQQATDSGTEEPTAAAESAPPETPAETAAETPNQEKEAPAMAESTTPAAETPGTEGIDALGAKIDKLSDALAGFVTAMTPKPAAAESAPAEPVAEAAPEPVQETEEQRIDRLVAERLAAALPTAVQEHVERQGPPQRKGLVAPVNEHTAPVTPAEPGLNSHGAPADWPDKPLHEYSPDERTKYFGPALRQHVLQDRFRG